MNAEIHFAWAQAAEQPSPGCRQLFADLIQLVLVLLFTLNAGSHQQHLTWPRVFPAETSFRFSFSPPGKMPWGSLQGLFLSIPSFTLFSMSGGRRLKPRLSFN